MRQFLGPLLSFMSSAKVCRVSDTIGLLFLKGEVGEVVDIGATDRLGLLIT